MVFVVATCTMTACSAAKEASTATVPTTVAPAVSTSRPDVASAASDCAGAGTVERTEAPFGPPGARLASVYLPACYARDPQRRFPVVFLLHGAGADATQWPAIGLATTADDLITSGAIPPMIVVMGLTGVITAATLRLVPLRTPWFETVTSRTGVLGETLRILDRAAHQHAMAWLDPCAPCDRMGRGVVTSGEPALAEAGASQSPRARSARDGSDSGGPIGLMRPSLIRLASTSYWRMAAPGPTERTIPLAAFLFPFDRLGSWNRLFGPRGLIQWQGAVPRGSEDALAELLASYRRHEVVSPLVSLKRFGSGNPGPLSFPIDGWTIAIDLPAASPELGVLLRRLDSITAQAGGRVYLAKDSRLRPSTLREMYPRLEEWCAVRRRADPAGLMCSDLARRLHLLEAEA